MFHVHFQDADGLTSASRLKPHEVFSFSEHLLHSPTELFGRTGEDSLFLGVMHMFSTLVHFSVGC